MSASHLTGALRAAAQDRAFLVAENRLLWRATAMAGTLALVLAVALAVVVVRGEPEPDIVASTADGRVIPVTRLDEPMMSDEAFRMAVGRSILATFTLGYHDYRRRLDAARRYYTAEAFESLLEQLERSGVLRRLRDELQVVETVLEGTPTIVSRQAHEGVLYLELETPVLMTFRSGNARKDQRLTVKTLVRRVPLSENPAGWAVGQTIVAPRTGRAR